MILHPPFKALTAAIEIAHEAGEILLRHWRRSAVCESKGNWDIVTAADHEVEAHVARRLESLFPGEPVVGEESGGGLHGEVCWIVDPLDGTKNFHHRFEYFCTMLARLRHGEPDLAVIYDPMRRETYWAEAGQGAYRDGEPLAVSSTATLREALVVSGFPSGRRHRESGAEPFLRVLLATQALRRTGCTGLDLANLASGRVDAVWDVGLEPWDLAPGLLIAREAGALAVDWSGEPYRLGESHLIVAPPLLVEPLTALLTQPH